jgi:hypothetical protein
MKMRKHLARSIIGLGICCLMLALAAPSYAGWQGRHRGRAYSKADVDRIIKRVETRSDNFVKLFDESLDRSALDGTDREDRLNERAKDLEKALDRLREDFDRTDTWRDTRGRVEDVMREAEAINRVVNSRRLTTRVEASWTLLRNDLNRLAGIYNLEQLKR